MKERISVMRASNFIEKNMFIYCLVKFLKDLKINVNMQSLQLSFEITSDSPLTVYKYRSNFLSSPLFRFMYKVY